MNRIVLVGVAAAVVIAVAAGVMMAGCKPKQPVAKTEPCAAPDSAAVVEGAKLENMLTLWGEGKQDEAVAALLAVDWSRPMVLGSKARIFEMTEKEFSSLATQDRQKLSTEMLNHTLVGVKGIVSEVYTRAMQAIGEKDYKGAEKSLQSGVMLGRMMNNDRRQMIIVRLVGIAVEKKIMNGMIELYTQSGDQQKLGDVKAELAKVDAQAAEIKNKVEGRQSDVRKPIDANSAAAAGAGKKKEGEPADAGGQKMVVKVVDKETGKPLARAKVSARRGEKEVTGITGQDGTAIIRMKQSGKSVRLQTTCAGHVGLYRSLRGDMARNLPKEYVFELDTGMTIGGVIKDPNNQPIQGVTVTIFRYTTGTESAAEKALPYLHETVATDNKGAWRCCGVPRDMENVAINFQHPQYQEDGCDVRKAEQAAALEAGNLETVLKDGLRICGVVRKADGTPVKGATVLRGDQDCGEEHCRATTDEQGGFKFANVGEGLEILTVTAAGFSPELKTISMVKAEADVEFVMGPARTLKGRVVDAKGAAVSGVTVSIGKWRGYRMLSNRAVSNAAGRVEITGLPSDEMEVRLTKKGLTEKIVSGVLADGQEKTFVLGAGVRVRGKVVDAETGKPVANFRLIPGIEWEAGQGIVWQNLAGWSRQGQGGQYDYIFETAGARYAVRIEADGYRKAESRMIEPGETEAVYDFGLVRGASVAGIVLGPDGKPAAGVTVVIGNKWGVVMEGGKLANEGMSLDNGEPYPTTKTDPNGKFSFAEPNVPYMVAAVGVAGAGGLSAEDFARAGQIKLKAWGRIEGQYVVGTKPAGKRQVKVEPESSREEMGYIIARYNKMTDSDGRFVIEKVLPCRFRVEWVPVEVSPGQTAHVRIGGTGRTLTARMELPPDIRKSKIAIECWVSQGDDWRDWWRSVPWPKNVDEMTSAEIRDWLDGFQKSPEGRQWSIERMAAYQQRRAYQGKVEGNKITIEDVNEGRYKLYGVITTKDGRGEPNYSDMAILGTMNAVLEVPPVRPQDVDKPLDIGGIGVAERPKAGDEAPAITVDGAGNEKVRLADHRGKTVLLVIYSSDCFRDPNNYHPRWLEFRKAYDRFAGYEDLSIIGVAIESKDDPIARADTRGMALKWTQGFAGDQREAICIAFAMEITPRIVLIDRDGKIIANGIRGEELMKKVEEAVGK